MTTGVLRDNRLIRAGDVPESHWSTVLASGDVLVGATWPTPIPPSAVTYSKGNKLAGATTHTAWDAGSNAWVTAAGQHPVEIGAQVRPMPANVNLATGGFTGIQPRHIVGRTYEADQSWRPVWSSGAAIALPTTTAALTIVSDQDGDALGQAGANVVNVTYVDANYAEQQAVVNLAGRTAVQVAPAALRVQDVLVVVDGTRQSNLGRLTLKVGTQEVGSVLPGKGTWRQCVFTVPALRAFIPESIHFVPQRDNPTQFRWLMWLSSGARIEAYESGWYDRPTKVELESPPDGGLLAATSFWWECRTQHAPTAGLGAGIATAGALVTP